MDEQTFLGLVQEVALANSMLPRLPPAVATEATAPSPPYVTTMLPANREHVPQERLGVGLVAGKFLRFAFHSTFAVASY